MVGWKSRAVLSLDLFHLYLNYPKLRCFFNRRFLDVDWGRASHTPNPFGFFWDVAFLGEIFGEANSRQNDDDTSTNFTKLSNFSSVLLTKKHFALVVPKKNICFREILGRKMSGMLKHVFGLWGNN